HADIKDVRLAGHSGHGASAASAKWADHAPAHLLVERRAELLGGCVCCGQKQCKDQKRKHAESKVHVQSPKTEKHIAVRPVPARSRIPRVVSWYLLQFRKPACEGLSLMAARLRFLCFLMVLASARLCF